MRPEFNVGVKNCLRILLVEWWDSRTRYVSSTFTLFNIFSHNFSNTLTLKPSTSNISVKERKGPLLLVQDFKRLILVWGILYLKLYVLML